MQNRALLVPLCAALALAFVLGACSILLDHKNEQCSTDSDCSKFSANAVCVNKVCVANSSDGGVGGPDGCFAGNPTTSDQLLNACSTAECIPFDNCAKLGLCSGAKPPDNVDPPAGTGGSSSGDAGAPPTTICNDPVARPNVVYVTGSTNMVSFLKEVAPLLAKDNPPYTIIWQSTSSCTGTDKAFNPDPTARVMSNSASQPIVYYDATGDDVPCVLSPDNIPIDVGESDIFASSCEAKLGYTPDPTGIGEYFGPIQTMTMVVPGTSSQRAISAEAAQIVFGQGGQNLVQLPWVDPEYFFIRSNSTGTNNLISRAINVNPSKWWGVDKKTASNMVLQLKEVPAAFAEKTIGTVSTDLADKERGNINVLAFQSAGQLCGYYPDSTRFAVDKANVRNGHYPIWGPLHFFVRLENGVPSTAAGEFVLRFSVSRLDQDLVQAIAQSGNIPACAMSVNRDTEMGPLHPYTPPYRCDCFFEFATTGSSKCQPCTGTTDCPPDRPACNYGYCESS